MSPSEDEAGTLLTVSAGRSDDHFLQVSRERSFVTFHTEGVAEGRTEPVTVRSFISLHLEASTVTGSELRVCEFTRGKSPATGVRKISSNVPQTQRQEKFTFFQGLSY